MLDNNRDKNLELINQLVEKQSITDMVLLMNEVFGTQQDTSIEAITDQVKNILDELDELDEAINEMDINEVKDALGDILVFAIGGLFITGKQAEDNKFEIGNYALSDEQNKKALMFGMTGLRNQLQEAISKSEFPDNIFQLAIDFSMRWSTRFNYDLHPLLVSITQANYGKLIFSFDELEDTIKSYDNLGVTTYTRFFDNSLLGNQMKYAVIYSLLDQKDTKGKAYRRNKFLKSIKFVSP